MAPPRERQEARYATGPAPVLTADEYEEYVAHGRIMPGGATG